MTKFVAKVNSVKNAVSKIQASNAAKVQAKITPQAPKEEPKADFATFCKDMQMFSGKVCEVLKGKKRVGETGNVFFVSKGSEKKEMIKGKPTGKVFRKKPVSRVEFSDGEIEWISPEYLEIKGDMSKEDLDRLVGQQQAENEETLYVAATCTAQTDTSAQLAYTGWMKRVWFQMPSMISSTGFTDASGKDIFEIVAWKVRKDCGMDSYNALLAKQSELAAIVEAK